MALALLFTKLKQAIESATSETVRYGVREFLVFMGIGVWASTKAGHRFVGSLAVRLVKAGRWPVTVVP